MKMRFLHHRPQEGGCRAVATPRPVPVQTTMKRLSPSCSTSEAADTFYKVATGRTTPLNEYLEEWLTVRPRPLRAATVYQYRRAFTVFADWCKASHLAATLQRVATNPWAKTNIKQDA
jgi:hypothetical protein